MGKWDKIMVMKVCLALALVGIALAAPSKKSETSILSATKSESASTASSQRRSSDGPSHSSRRLLTYGQTVSKISPTYGPMEGNTLLMIESAAAASSAEQTHLAASPLECGFQTAGSASWSKTTATYINATFFSCRTPKHSTGAKTFQLSVAGVAVLPPLSPSPISQPCTCRISR